MIIMTMLVCQNLNIIGVGIDLDEAYCEMVLNNLRNINETQV